MRLFDDFIRTNKNIAEHVSTIYTFINESAWSSMEYIRALLEVWSSSYPLNSDFLSRFKSEDDQQHKSAFFELTMHRLFEVQGFHVNIHESNDPNSRKCPDFHVSNNELSFYTECTLAPNPLVDSKYIRIKEQLCDIIEKVHSPDYFINIYFNSSGNSQPSLTAFKNFVNDKLDQIKNSNLNINEVSPKYLFTSNGWEVDISMIRKSKSANRPLGSINYGPASIIDSQKPLRYSLNQKRGGKYGDFSEPYIIAINTADITLEKSEIIFTLFGSYNVNSMKQVQVDTNSFFQTYGNPHNRRVSAVILAHNVSPWNLHVASIELWHNPWSIFPLKIDSIDFDEYYYVKHGDSDYQLNHKPGKKMCDLLEIDTEKIIIKDGL